MRRFWRGTLLAILGVGSLMAGCGGLFGDEDSVIHTVTPIGPSYGQIVTDCNTGKLVKPDTLIQPAPGCDGWETNRYERPFNAGDQDEYFPDLDILQAELGEAGEWFFLRIELYDLREDEDSPLGTYAIELDLDQDRRGDALVLVREPGKNGETDWKVAGVQVFEDSDQTVGNDQPAVADHPFENDGYDKLLFNEGVGSDDPDVAWARFIPGDKTIVEIAFKSSLINHDEVFLWWVWAQQSMDPLKMDYHDAIEHEDAGDAYESQMYFPSDEINQVDNTCAALWGAPPDEDPSLCVNDPNVPQPTPGSGTPTFRGSATPTSRVTPTPSPPEDGNITPSLTPTEPLGCVDATGIPTHCTPTPTETRDTQTPTATTGGGGDDCLDENDSPVTCTPPPDTEPCNPFSNFATCTPTATERATETDEPPKRQH